MKLPAAERAVIEPARIWDYLLSTSHPVGRFKVTVWIVLFGGDVPQFVTAFPGEMT